MATLTAADLDEFVQFVNSECSGNISHPGLSRYHPIHFKYDTPVDQELSPFSDEYFDQQIALYEEISGRKLNQWDGELHPADIAALGAAPNPLGIVDPAHLAEHVRALSAMLSICGLKDRAKVLDMGAGHGLSSEVFAFCGCQVHAIDIDPLLGELSLARSAARGLGITRSTLNFDDLSTVPSGTYEAAFFFQSFHHCLRPWELIATLKTKLVDGGFIAFTGEPIQTHWWKHWGIRLDPESLYVAKSHGWFESGWSADFLRQCFERNGMTLQFFDGGHAGGEIGVATSGSLDHVRLRAAQLGHRTSDAFSKLYHTQIGTAAEVRGQPGFRVAAGHADGYLVFGPYVTLSPGRYLVSMELEGQESTDSFVHFDIAADSGTRILHSERLSHSQAVSRTLEIPHTMPGVEVRVFAHGPGGWACSQPEIRRI